MHSVLYGACIIVRSAIHVTYLPWPLLPPSDSRMLSDSVHNRRSVCPRFCGLYNEALFATLAIRVIARVIQLSPRVPRINNILVKAAIERLLPWCCCVS